MAPIHKSYPTPANLSVKLLLIQIIGSLPDTRIWMSLAVLLQGPPRMVRPNSRSAQRVERQASNESKISL
ncbi:predicted protein [Sclerotinia sclerotiorum 1980 UF-70]|uniref:Uncharacterized protein n=1 Tax=Sclerotinia sclerotiorum (strain ATCC 18683 / 1980 / Ss-1) TaxID=665079 RepID=A7F5L5_SCLS1|nr:predicted protein [Sclerotinia sclerotiorum 1980 UF-70]EDN98036.1 predicted protein [Sclerotinia sclerotiorum 1980 UF-70]